MTTDHYILAVCLLAFLGGVAYAMWPIKTKPLAQPAAPSFIGPPQQSAPTLGNLVKNLDAQALDQGAAALERQIISALADAHVVRLQASLAPKAPAAPTPPQS